jgi:hypothetical protein
MENKSQLNQINMRLNSIIFSKYTLVCYNTLVCSTTRYETQFYFQFTHQCELCSNNSQRTIVENIHQVH